MAFGTWMLLILKIICVLIGGHLAITKLLPELKKVLSFFVKRMELITSIVSVLIIYILVLVLKFIIGFIAAVENVYLGYANVLLPGIEVILMVIPYVLYFFVAVVIVAGLSKK